ERPGKQYRSAHRESAQRARTRSGAAPGTTAPRQALRHAPLPDLPPVADPWRRFMGIVYESIILFGVVWFADYVSSALTQFRGQPGPLRTAFQLFTLAVLAVYFCWFWSNGRRSLPMKTLSLQLLDSDARPLRPA